MKSKLLIPLCLLLLLTACADDTQSTGKSIDVYFAARQPQADGLAIDSEPHILTETEDSVTALTALLLGDPLSNDLVSPIPSGVSLNTWSLQEGVLYLEFSEGYGGLSGINLTIADYCITLTLCQLDGVRSVVISVDGDLIPSRYYQALHSSDVLLSDTEVNTVFTGVALYFPTEDGSALGIEFRDVLNDGGLTRSEAVVTALMQGPEGAGLRSLMPEHSTMLSTEVENGVCYVNFSAAFGEALLSDTPEGALQLYSIVDTLCALSGVDKVQLLVEGEAPASYGGVPTLKPLEPDFGLVKND